MDIVPYPLGASGETQLAFHPNGKYVFIGGADSLLYQYDLDQGCDSEPSNCSEADGRITSVSVSGNVCATTSLDGTTRAYKVTDSMILSAEWVQAAPPARCVSIDPTGTWVATSSEEPRVLVRLVENRQVTFALEGHKGPVRKVSWHPTNLWLATSGADTNIKIWEIERLPDGKATGKLITTITAILPPPPSPRSQPEPSKDKNGDELPKDSNFHDVDVTPVWHPSGKHFYVISAAKDITKVSCEGWKQTALKIPANFGSVRAIAISLNGEYLASAHKSKLHIWSLSRKAVISSHELKDTTVHQVAWAPTRNLVAWTDTLGNHFRWSGVIPEELSKPYGKVTAAAQQAKAQNPVNNLFDNQDDKTDDIPSDPGQVDNALRDETTVDDDDGGEGDDDDDDGEQVEEEADGLVREIVSITKAQRAFQPGATPMRNTRRYLAHNTLGAISVQEHHEHNRVDVYFYNSATRASYQFEDKLHFNMASLGQRGILFACSPLGERPALVRYSPHGTSGDWDYELRKKSRVLGIAAGGVSPRASLRDNDDPDLEGLGTIVIATSEDDLTFLTGSGRERRIMGLGAEFVSMVASNEWVFVVHRAGSTTIDGSQNLSYSLINFEDFTVRQRDILPIPKNQILKWIGITDEGAPAIYDSAGYLHVLAKFRIPHHASWARILDTNLLARRVGKEESYWPVGVAGDNFMCLIIKGSDVYPDFPRPLVQEIPIEMPFRKKDTPQEQLLERDMFLLDFERDALGDELTSKAIVTREHIMDKQILVLIQAALVTSDPARALEFCKLLHTIRSFDFAINVAEYQKAWAFKQRVELLKEARMAEDDRLVEARERRIQWTRTQSAPRQILDDAISMVTPIQPPPFQTNRPAQNYRPGLTKASPIVEQPTLVVGMDVDVDADGFAPLPSFNGEAKRKRSEVEDEDESQKTEPSSSMPPPPQKKSNPFAKKPVAADTGNNRNPFSKRSDSVKTLQKSESFFDKVDQVEVELGGKAKRSANTLKPKEKKQPNGMKEGPRQTTLLGLLPKKTKGQQGDEDVSTESQMTSVATVPAGFDSDPSADSLEETQMAVDETQETQLIEEIPT